MRGSRSAAARRASTVPLLTLGVLLLPVLVVTAGLLHALALLATGAVTWLVAPQPASSSGEHHEATTWSAFGTATRIVAVGLVLEGLSAIIWARDRSALPSGAVLVALSLGASWFAYRGLIHWNRFRILTRDPADWINGVCAVLVTVSQGLLVVDLTGSSISRWPGAEAELWLTQIAVLLLLGGTGTSVAGLAGLLRDRRLWLVTIVGSVGTVAILAAGATRGFAASLTATEVAWAALAVAMSIASLAPPVAPMPRLTTSTASAAGAVGVLASGLVTLTLAGAIEQHGRWPTLVTAAAGVLGCAVRMLLVFRELTELADARDAAHTDALTGVVNRRGLTVALQRTADAPGARSLLIVDLDRFKEVNDRYGHAAGDEVLLVVSQRLLARLPDDAVLARLGGDEFAVLLPDASAAETEAIGAALLAAVRAPLTVAGRRVRMSASIGLCAGQGALDDAELVRRADTAMYVAKRGGCGVAGYDDEADRRSRQERALLDDLRQALGAGGRSEEFVVHLQPQVDLATGRVTGAEALVRWEHPRLGVLAPVCFLDLVHQAGLMDILTARVLDAAVVAAATWRSGGHDLTVSVNLSPSCLVDPALLGTIDACLARHGVSPRSLVVEVTETALMCEPEQALRALEEMTRRGLQISIDDYGTGYSALSYLNDLPAGELKLDRSFVGRLCADPRTEAIVAGTIDLAHHLGLRVTAEGVEDVQTLERLRALRCDTTQGYLHAKPQPVADFLVWLESAGMREPAAVVG